MHLMLALFKIQDKLLSQEAMTRNRNNTRSYRCHSHIQMSELRTSWKAGRHPPGRRNHTPHVTPWGWCYLLVLASVELPECADSGRLFIRMCFDPLAWRAGPRLPNVSWKTLDHRIRLSQFLTANMPGGHRTICYSRCLLQRVRSCCQHELKVGEGF